MTGALPPGGRAPGTHGGGKQPSGGPYDIRDLWPRDFEWDEAPGLVFLDRATWTWDVSPSDFDDQVADEVIDELLARVDGRRTPSRS